jgi:hypothetical protein
VQGCGRRARYLLDIAGEVVLAREAPLRLLLRCVVGHPLEPHAARTIASVTRQARGERQQDRQWALAELAEAIVRLCATLQHSPSVEGTGPG